MARLERGVRPIGFWSTLTSRSSWSRPETGPTLSGAADRGVGGLQVISGFRRGVRFRMQPGADHLGEDLADQGRLAGAGDAGDRGQDAEREVGVEVAQVVAADVAQLQPAGSFPAASRAAARR